MKLQLVFKNSSVIIVKCTKDVFDNKLKAGGPTAQLFRVVMPEIQGNVKSPPSPNNLCLASFMQAFWL